MLFPLPPIHSVMLLNCGCRECVRAPIRRVRRDASGVIGPGGGVHQLSGLRDAFQLAPGERIRYEVAWVASCILYDREKLLAVGGFTFWARLPRFHSGEEVLVQNLLMRRWGGCGILPSGTYYAQMPTTVPNERGTVDGHALALLPEMVARYVEPFT